MMLLLIAWRLFDGVTGLLELLQSLDSRVTGLELYRPDTTAKLCAILAFPHHFALSAYRRNLEWNWRG
jgi:hypothetical protein